jgi:hypothetical protein
MNITREFDYDAYRDSETVRELVDAILIVNRNIQSNEGNEELVEHFDKYMEKEITRIAPKFWESIKQND